MSGGSFNYLCCRDVEDLMNSQDDLESMRNALIKYGYEDIAKDTQRLIEYIKSARCTIETLGNTLEPVFHAVEWYESGDYGKDTMINILEKYRRKESEGKDNE